MQANPVASFRLARLLRLRTQMRRLREHEAAALAVRVEELARSAAATGAARADRAAAEARASAEGTLTTATLALGRDYDRALAAAERACVAALGDAERALAAKREQLVYSHREERTMRRLEETERARAATAAARTVERGLDEIAIERYERGRRRGDGDDG